jgi:hypothetical protein
MKHINKYNENIENEPYFIMVFNMNLKKDDVNPEGILKSPPIRGIKNMKRWFGIINFQNRTMGMQVGKITTIEKYNFETMEDLDRWEEQNPE